jgi:hypothetical protein
MTEVWTIVSKSFTDVGKGVLLLKRTNSEGKFVQIGVKLCISVKNQMQGTFEATRISLHCLHGQHEEFFNNSQLALHSDILKFLTTLM